MTSKYIVSPKWLHSNLDRENIVVLDASLKPVSATDSDNSSCIIPGAKKFDIKNVFSDKNSLYDSMMPDEAIFIEEIRKLGINQDSIIVLYDSQGIYSSPRAWFMIRSLGHKEVYVMDGGLPEWMRSGFSTEESYGMNTEYGNFSVTEKITYFCNADYVASGLQYNDRHIIDARSASRFSGIEPEPREGLNLGHIPGAVNLPFSKVLDGNGYKDSATLSEIFRSVSNKEKEFIFSCGSGITACIPALAAIMCGYPDVKIYDGSWSEWGDASNNYPVELHG